jgi:hypothetical protein
MEKFHIQNIIHGNVYLNFKLENKSDSVEWVLISVYGAVQEEEKNSFL